MPSLPQTERSKFDKPNPCRELGLIERGFDSADGLSFSDANREPKNIFCVGRDMRNTGAATAEEDTRPDVIEQPRMGKFLCNKLEDFLETKRHDPPQMFQIDVFARQAAVTRQLNDFSFDVFLDDGGSMLDFQLFGPAQRDLETISKVIGDMVSPDGENARMFNDSIGANDVFSRAAAKIDNQCAELLFFRTKHCQRGCKAVENNIVDLQLKTFDAADGILDSVEVAVDDMDIDLHACPEHTDRIHNAFLPINQEVLANGMNDMILGGEIDGFGILDDIMDVILGDFTIGGHHGVDTAVVETSKMSPRDAEIDASNLDIRHLFGLDNGVANVLFREMIIDDFTFSDTAGSGLADADDVECAGFEKFTHHGADFGRADFKTYDDLAGLKHGVAVGIKIWNERSSREHPAAEPSARADSV